MSLPRQAAKYGLSQAPFRVAVVAAICTFVMASCRSRQTPVTELKAATSTSTHIPAQSSAKHQHSPFATKPAGAAAAAAGANSYKELLKRYPQAKQKQIEDWYAKYADDSMTFTSNEQWQWMQQHDYPTPDDVLRAYSMSESELRELAMQGDTKANFFYLTRLLHDYAQANRISSTRHKAGLRTKINASMDRALASGSAFAGYLFGSYYAALHGESEIGIGRAAGLTWVDSFGDGRAVYKYPMAAGFPRVSGARVAAVYFDMFAAAASRKPYFLNEFRGRSTPLIPLH